MNHVRKSWYQKVVFILGKIAKDKTASTSIDEEDIKRQKKIVVKYESFMTRKQSEPHVKTSRQTGSQKRNPSKMK